MAETTTTLKGLIRERWGGTIDELAKAAGVAGSTAWNWWGGHARPQPGKRPRLADVLGVSLDELESIIGADAARDLRLPSHAVATVRRAADLLDFIGAERGAFSLSECRSVADSLSGLLNEGEA